MLKKYILLALTILYFFSFDQSGYITDLTKINPNRANYVAHDINPANIPTDVMLGCYKFIEGQFVLDENKRNEIIAAQEALPEW